MLRRFFTHSLTALCASMGLTHSARATTASSKVKPRHVICFLGEWKSMDAVEKTVKAFGRGFSVDREYSQVGADARMTKAFAVSLDRVTNTFTEQDHARIKRHNTVAYVLSPPMVWTTGRSLRETEPCAKPGCVGPLRMRTEPSIRAACICWGSPILSAPPAGPTWKPCGGWTRWQTRPLQVSRWARHFPLMEKGPPRSYRSCLVRVTKRKIFSSIPTAIFVLRLERPVLHFVLLRDALAGNLFCQSDL